MKALFLIIVLLHGLIHSLGFLKAFGFIDVKALTLPISRPIGAVWLISTVLFLMYGLLYYFNYNYAWLFGLAAMLVSQVLIIGFWPDAKFGTVPNLIILAVVLFSYGNNRFEALITKEKKELLLSAEVQPIASFSKSDIKDLPSPVKKWLMNSGALGQKKTLNGKIRQKALIKMTPEQEDWHSATALQYTTVNKPSFLWAVDMKMNSLMWFRGRDKFKNGKGEMLIKMNSLINVVNETGEKIDEGSNQRFLGEMVWFPSLAVSPYVSWEEIDDLSAKATLTYKKSKGSGTFYFNEKGDFVKFVALRFQGNEPDAKRKEWVLTVDDYSVFDGIKVPSKMKATWRLDEKDWTWLQLEIETIEYNISP